MNIFLLLISVLAVTWALYEFPEGEPCLSEMLSSEEEFSIDEELAMKTRNFDFSQAKPFETFKPFLSEFNGKKGYDLFFPELLCRALDLKNVIGEDYAIFLGRSPLLLKYSAEFLSAKMNTSPPKKWISVLFSNQPGVIKPEPCFNYVTSEAVGRYWEYLEVLGIHQIHGKSTKFYIVDIYETGVSLVAFMRILHLFYKKNQLESPNIVFISLSGINQLRHVDHISYDSSSKQLVIQAPPEEIIAGFIPLKIDVIFLSIESTLANTLGNTTMAQFLFMGTFFGPCKWRKFDLLAESKKNGVYWPEFKKILDRGLNAVYEYTVSFLSFKQRIYTEISTINAANISSISSELQRLKFFMSSSMIAGMASVFLHIAEKAFEKEKSALTFQLSLKSLALVKSTLACSASIDYNFEESIAQSLLSEIKVLIEKSGNRNEKIMWNNFMDNLPSFTAGLSSENVVAMSLKSTGNDFLKRGDFALASSHYTRGIQKISVLKSEKQDISLLIDLTLNLSFSLLRERKYDEALRMGKRALAMNPQGAKLDKALYRCAAANEELFNITKRQSYLLEAISNLEKCEASNKECNQKLKGLRNKLN